QGDMMLTLKSLETLLDKIDLGNYDDEQTMAHLIRTAADKIEGAEAELIEQDEHGNCDILVIRGLDGGARLILEDDANGTNIWTDPRDFSDQLDDASRERGWDAETEPHIDDATERAGVHGPTGIQYEPTGKQRIEADAELALMRLYRELRLLPVST